MDVILKENQLWYCDICDKTISIKNKSKHINSNSHKHKQKYGTVVKEYEIIRPNDDRIVARASIICRDEHFHTFEYKFVYVIKLTNTNSIVNSLSITYSVMSTKMGVVNFSISCVCFVDIIDNGAFFSPVYKISRHIWQW